MAHRVAVQRQCVSGLAARLESLNPDAVLARGYAIVRERETGSVVTSVGQTAVGQGLTLQLRDGEVLTRVEESV